MCSPHKRNAFNLSVRTSCARIKFGLITFEVETRVVMASEIVVYSISADVQWKNGILYFMSSSL